MHDHCIQCNPWPTSGYHGCSGGDGWKLLDKATVDASMCESLCLQHASGDGCCYVSGSGCYWNGGATYASSNSCSDGHCLSMECSVATCRKFYFMLSIQMNHYFELYHILLTTWENLKDSSIQ